MAFISAGVSVDPITQPRAHFRRLRVHAAAVARLLARPDVPVQVCVHTPASRRRVCRTPRALHRPYVTAFKDYVQRELRVASDQYKVFIEDDDDDNDPAGAASADRAHFVVVLTAPPCMASDRVWLRVAYDLAPNVRVLSALVGAFAGAALAVPFDGLAADPLHVRALRQAGLQPHTGHVMHLADGVLQVTGGMHVPSDAVLPPGVLPVAFYDAVSAALAELRYDGVGRERVTHAPTAPRVAPAWAAVTGVVHGIAYSIDATLHPRDANKHASASALRRCCRDVAACVALLTAGFIRDDHKAGEGPATVALDTTCPLCAPAARQCRLLASCADLPHLTAELVVEASASGCVPAAVAGALCGAASGLRGFPRQWLDAVVQPKIVAGIERWVALARFTLGVL